MTTFEAIGVTTSASANANDQPVVLSRPFSDPNRLAPQAAFGAQPPLRRPVENELFKRSINGASDAEILNTTSAVTSVRRRRDKERGRSGSRRGKGVWKKLLWVKQPKYPDNYTDPPTFLSHLQRNPRLRPYDFWPLVADFTVIVQHLCSVSIFVCCFVGIYQERVSPVSVVGWGSAGTVLGWVLWDSWVSQAEAAKTTARRTHIADVDVNTTDSLSTSGHASMSTGSSQPTSFGGKVPQGLGFALAASNLSNHRDHSHSHSGVLTSSASTAPSPILSHQSSLPNFASHSVDLSPTSSNPLLSPQNQQRFATVKSAILIYCALLGLSPILKSLTLSTSKDSIWALSCWLMCINIFFFDYGGGVGVKFPASLSTNAALMSSTVLASRLPSTTHVFSLTLFSIEVFGLFPVFRRHLRHVSWRGHFLLTLALHVGAGAGMGATLSGGGRWKAIVGGILLWGYGSVIVMGGCSWWLIGLQKYKNVVIGPWDPARPVIRGGGWD